MSCEAFRSTATMRRAAQFLGSSDRARPPSSSEGIGHA
jgi:hypothetical protein